MLDALLEYGRHLPVLAMVLAWSPPASWVRLRRARRGFLVTLSEQRLKELAEELPLSGATFLEVVDTALLQRDELREAAGDSQQEKEEAETQHELTEGEAELQNSADTSSLQRAVSSALELHACEVAFAALLRGMDVNKAEPLTGVTPLMRAAEESHLQLCQLLLERRANADSSSVGGTTALSLALDPCCMRCMTMSNLRCHCRRLGLARLLLRHTSRGLPAAFAATVRLAVQDEAWLPAVTAFTEEKTLSINAELLGPDFRRGNALSVALEQRVRPVEATPKHRRTVVASLLALRADIHQRGPYAAWWGGTATNLLDFAAQNGCDESTIQLLKDASMQGSAH